MLTLDTSRCKQHVQAKGYEYEKFVPLKEIPGAVYEGHLINFPLLIQGNKEAHILLSETATPNWEKDNVYEFVVGGWNDKKVAIRRKRNGGVLQEEDSLNNINAETATKFVVDIDESKRNEKKE